MRLAAGGLSAARRGKVRATMRLRKPAEQPDPEMTPTEAPAIGVGPPHYERPKVICIDLLDEAVSVLRGAGYQVTTGTLGQPFSVPAADRYMRLPMSAQVPGFAEQEVVIVQHASPAPVGQPTGSPPAPTDGPAVWATCKFGVIDSRPYFAQVVLRERMERILEYGGAAICFCEPKTASGLVEATGGGSHMLMVHNDFYCSVWDMFRPLDYFKVTSDHGQEVKPTSESGVVAPLARHLRGAMFNCTLSPRASEQQRWVPLAKNKYGADVAGIFFPAEKDGCIVLLPQVADQGATLRVLLEDVLPALVPKLFPESQKFAWRHQDPYELPEVVRLQAEIEAVRAAAAAQESELQTQADEVRARDGWLHDLLTETGEKLVDAVEQAMRELGLQDVRKVDDEAEQKETGRRREDIQVHGQSPIMLVEVKGLTGVPKEADTLQVAKYLVPRMQAWERTDVRGLSVVNHQRGLPPLERNNEHTFQDDVLENAEHQSFGVMTTFDLFRLVVSKRRLGWADSTVVPLLYRNGRVGVVPEHYEFVGVVDGFYEKAEAVVIAVTDAGFAVGDRLAFELPIYFEEVGVPSIQLQSVAADAASAGQRVGVNTTLTKEQARNGVRVYRVGTPTEGPL
jgi:hypothetical protein